MASVISDTVIIRPAVPAVTENRYVLTLTAEEAQVLRDVGHLIGGPPSGRRGLFDNISKALSSVGITPNESFEMDLDRAGRHNSIYFN